MSQKNHTRFIVTTILILALAAIGCGTFLVYKGYQTAGELLLANGGIGAISGLIGLISQARPSPPPPDVVVTNPPVKTEIKNNVAATSTPEPTPPTT